ncbi:metalloregulator ArsR/SmtB family transcription factor [uncultured Desulfosarcina sp.]|uniref:ArsR/SmtB family transcription factor n=1 Tax=uncultured Desulfosarcina sp. TaxID=218289 RepID=UPI0029C828C6|nr:metalloregulator ArsR/SmtB family transcription factor [uncultured Desulfosarcina sp.]
MLSFMNVTKALSDENRIRILLALHAHDELCVCNINELLELAPSTVSKHLFLLKNARLVKARKDGRWMHYRLNRGPDAPEIVTQALDWIVRSVSDEPEIKADREKLARILSVPLETACCQ